MAFVLYKPLKFALDGIPASNLTDFPKRFKIVGDADIAAECASGGGIKATTPDGTTDLPIEVLWSETDLSTGDVEFWVKVDLLTAANVGDLIARLYYAAGETTVEDHAGVWSNGYALVMHLEEDPSGTAPQMYDSASESYIGTSGGSMTSGDLVAGQVGNGLDFDGSDDQLTGGISLSSSSATVELIANYNSSLGSGSKHIFDLGVIGQPRIVLRASNNDWFIRSSSSQTVSVAAGMSAGILAGYAVSVNGTTSRSYVNGSQIATNTNVSYSLPSFSSWSVSPTSVRFGGVLDEVRISSVARSADWLAYAYQDDFANADTFTLGDEEGGVGPSFVDNTRNYLNCILGGSL
jgi:hypothetical protein